MTQMTGFTLFNDTLITYNRDVNKYLIYGKVYIFFTEKWAELNLKKEEEDGELEVIEDTPGKKMKKRRGKHFDPKSSKKPRWEQDKDRDDGNNGGGMGVGQQAGIAV